ncbi:hypothetical protein A5635_17275 [Mycobacterium asiaticum]|uniref:Uncharacterized protein n=1 Tax=Mycobacterium asiaticum TaxID=1790 RepID=A0A1A3NUH7_MYCAS|nr:hypothetical protein A5635_17275 [Mycobacterium asiaticum]
MNPNRALQRWIVRQRRWFARVGHRSPKHGVTGDLPITPTIEVFDVRIRRRSAAGTGAFTLPVRAVRIPS